MATCHVARISGKKIKGINTVQFTLFVWTGKPSGVSQYNQDNCLVLKCINATFLKAIKDSLTHLVLHSKYIRSVLFNFVTWHFKTCVNCKKLLHPRSVHVCLFILIRIV